ncbi:hypothetical protein GG344DRAFT_59868 [Lentinula edodes]|nr:hypothetical protein GG344DRAFT_59868 [Lentinula edodes]
MINCALLCAMILALQIANCLSEHTLHINVTSEYLRRSLCYWAADNAEHAWDCAHSDILKVVVSHLCAPASWRTFQRTCMRSSTAGMPLHWPTGILNRGR